MTGTEVSRLRPPASQTFSTSRSLLKSTLIRCTPSQGALDFAWPLVEGVLSQFKVLLLGGLVVSGFAIRREERDRGLNIRKRYLISSVDLKFEMELCRNFKKQLDAAHAVTSSHLVFCSLFGRWRNRTGSWHLFCFTYEKETEHNIQIRT